MKRKPINRGLSICAVLILVILTYGCAATATRIYTGDSLPKEQVAIIEGKDTFLFLPIPIYLVSGSSARIHEIDNELLFRPTKKCEVLPGLHNLVVQTNYAVNGVFLFVPVDFWVSSLVSLQFNARAGHQYKIKVRYWSSGKSPALHVNVIDTESGEIVARY